MTEVVKIISVNNSAVTENEAAKQFVEHSPGGHSLLFFGDTQYAVLKEQNAAKLTVDKVRMTAGALARDLAARKVETAHVDEEVLLETFRNLERGTVITAFVEGWELGSYQFTKYKSKKDGSKTVLGVAGKEDVHSFVEEGKVRAEATAFSRDLMNEVPETLNPSTFPEVLKKNFEGTNVTVTVYDKKQIEKMEMNGVLTVGRGSKYEPSFVELVYKGDESKPLVALVGKGVTFDTGGISLKSGKDLSDMRMDMGGAAAVAGALTLLAKTKAKVNVVGLIPIVENIPDNTSVLPSEVITYKNGLTVQVGNTDAEGRLILADALIRAGELKAEYTVDIATLTGAIVAALGTKVAGIFGDDELASEMKKVGTENGDFVWQMPLVEEYDSTLDSDYADMNNISSLNHAGSITAALFLRRFVSEPSKWLHVDMAGMMSNSKPEGYHVKSGTGFGARLLADFTVSVSK